jgi:hypothetical protein
MGRVRLRLIGAVCIAGGVAGRVALSVWARPNDRVQGVELACFLAVFFGVGLALLAVPVVRRAYTPGDPSRVELAGCLLLALGAFAALVMVVSAMGP